MCSIPGIGDMSGCMSQHMGVGNQTQFSERAINDENG